jgi:hypothetical protein
MIDTSEHDKIGGLVVAAIILLILALIVYLAVTAYLRRSSSK